MKREKLRPVVLYEVINKVNLLANAYDKNGLPVKIEPPKLEEICTGYLHGFAFDGHAIVELENGQLIRYDVCLVKFSDV